MIHTCKELFYVHTWILHNTLTQDTDTYLHLAHFHIKRYFTYLIPTLPDVHALITLTIAGQVEWAAPYAWGRRGIEEEGTGSQRNI